MAVIHEIADAIDSTPIEEKFWRSGRNLFLYGSGGTGKSYIMKKIHEYAIDEGVKSCITATTGCASLNIGGSTLHHWAGLRLCTGTIKELYSTIMKSKKLKERWTETQQLIIDEISMIGATLFSKLETLARMVRKTEVPFGGIRIIVSGDFLQLPPINDAFVFTTEAWKSLNFEVIECKTPYRYPDSDFFSLLLRARVGKLTTEDVIKLQNRMIEYKPPEDSKDPIIMPTIIHSKKVDVNSINEMELNRIRKPAVEYDAEDFSDCEYMPEEYSNYLDNEIPRVVKLKSGAQVMLTYNLNVESGLTNGARGVVMDLRKESVIVNFKCGITMEIERNSFEKEIYDGEKKIKLVRQQIPLILAYAISIHKSQGSTLDFAIIDIGDTIFQAGMAYVCLSRIRTLEGLFIKSFNPKKIYANEEALGFDSEIRKISSVI